jgi:inner membrane protein
LYVLLTQEDYALLVGSLGLFATLAAVMYLTRWVDWYAATAPGEPAASQP